MFRSRSWFGGGWGRPKNPHSLEHLKYLYNVMARNQTVSEHNRGLLVESLRCIAEILIWGDQNDSSVFDFFLEKNMLSFFLRIMRQRSGGSSYVCVQLLQTLNILFENIRNETSLYYLLSNNHVNSIIVHKFDFSDEEVMAYYISFLKTLSLKLNAHTIHFFYNEHTNDFPLYTEAIKFFNHSESMVRIAVRTLTLNVFRVEDVSMLRFIRDRTAAPYFSNLAWFIAKHVTELDTCVRNDADHQSQNRLSDLVAEHLDHLHYLNDILCLNITDLNHVLTEHLLHKLLIPLYIYSLVNTVPLQDSASPGRSPGSFLRNTLTPQGSPGGPNSEQTLDPRVSCVVALFLLSQVFLIITHAPLVHSLAWIILNADASVFRYGAARILESYVDEIKTPESKPETELNSSRNVSQVGNCAAQCSIENKIENITQSSKININRYSESSLLMENTILENGPTEALNESSEAINGPVEEQTAEATSVTTVETANTEDALQNEAAKEKEVNKEVLTDEDGDTATSNITDEEKERMATSDPMVCVGSTVQKPFLETVLNALDCTENDYSALFALCLLYALANNRGISPELLKPVFGQRCGCLLADRLLQLVTVACKPVSRVRLATLELALRLLGRLRSSLSTPQRAALAACRTAATAALRNFYKSEEIFLDMFEHEYYDMSKGPLNVEWLCMDAAILLPPTGTPMTGIEFTKRLPCGEVERARRAIRVFFLIRELSMSLNGEPETQLPLTNPQQCVQVNNVLDLNNSDLIACTVLTKDGVKIRRFLVIDIIQLILVEPDTKKLGWGVAKLVGFLQDIEVVGDKDDSRCLHITIQRPLSSSTTNRVPLLSAKFIFDDHIRCMAAKQRLTKGRIKARQKKMHQIARLLDIPGPSGAPLSAGLLGGNSQTGLQLSNRPLGRGFRDIRPLFAGSRPGFVAPRRESLPGCVYRLPPSNVEDSTTANRANGAVKRDSHSPSPGRIVRQPNRSRDNSSSRIRSRDGSPRMPRPRSEEIPLELIKKTSGMIAEKPSAPISIISRPQTPRNELIGVAAALESIPQGTSEPNSEETSFIASQDNNSVVSPIVTNVKKKGAIETV